MHLVQILLPLYDNRGRPFERSVYAEVQKELTNRFGGLTAFTRAPAQGLWKNEGDTTYDDIVVLEVMAPDLNREWWVQYRSTLEALFHQDQVVIRAQLTELL
jgi:hypothetical protein